MQIIPEFLKSVSLKEEVSGGSQLSMKADFPLS